MKEEKQKYQLGKVNFTQEPLLPVFSEVFQRYPWVMYGENNQMPAYLISRYNNCAIHKAVVISKREQIMGDGLVSLNNPMATINLINSKENVSDVMRKCALDLVLFGGYALNIVWSRDRKSIAEIYHLDFSRVRCGKIDEKTDEIEKYYYSPEWGNIRKFPPTEYDAFNQEDGDPSQIYYYKQYSPSNSYYPQPDYSGAIAAINIDVQIKEFHSNNLSNSMMPSLWINMNNGIPGEEEQRLVTRALESQFTSVNNAGRPIISFNESKELSPEITQIATSGNDQYYSVIYEDIVRTILSAHRVSSGELYGISTAGKLGTRNEIVDHSEYFRKMVIQPYQKELLGCFDKLISLKFQKPTSFEIKPLSIFLTGDVTDNPAVIDKPVTSIEAESEKILINENIKGLKGREYQNLMRIVREYNKGKITKQQATQMLMGGYGLSEEDCGVWLGDDEEENL
jgi:hypothetical protein